MRDTASRASGDDGPSDAAGHGRLAAAATSIVDDTILSARHPFFRYPLEEPFELLSELLLVSGLLLKYGRDWRRAGRPQM